MKKEEEQQRGCRYLERARGERDRYKKGVRRESRPLSALFKVKVCSALFPLTVSEQGHFCNESNRLVSAKPFSFLSLVLFLFHSVPALPSVVSPLSCRLCRAALFGFL